jgi:hypothetical protein
VSQLALIDIAAGEYRSQLKVCQRITQAGREPEPDRSIEYALLEIPGDPAFFVDQVRVAVPLPFVHRESCGFDGFVVPAEKPPEPHGRAGVAGIGERAQLSRARFRGRERCAADAIGAVA